MTKEIRTQDVLFILYSLDQAKDMTRFIDLAYSTKGVLDFNNVDLPGSFIDTYNSEGRVGPFETEEELLQFSYDLCDQFKLESICVCDVETVNKSLKDAGNVNKLNDSLIENGEVLTDPDRKKKGLFSNIF
jgi:hypothetical protein